MNKQVEYLRRTIVELKGLKEEKERLYQEYPSEHSFELGIFNLSQHISELEDELVESLQKYDSK